MPNDIKFMIICEIVKKFSFLIAAGVKNIQNLIAEK